VSELRGVAIDFEGEHLMLRFRRLAVVLILGLTCGLLTAAPSSARSQRSEGAVASALVGELAKQGVKAGIGYLAPDMVKYTDPTAYQLGQIQMQLDQIQNSLTNLSASLNRLDLRLACNEQRLRLEPVVTGVITTERALKNVTLAPSFEGKKARLEEDVLPAIKRLNESGDQLLLHRALTGKVGESLITACGKVLEDQNGPVLTTAFSDRVENLYSTYSMTAATLLMLRVNYWHYYPGKYSEEEIQSHVSEVAHFLKTEEALLKPKVPWWGAVDVRTGLIWEKRTFETSHLIGTTLRQQGYTLSGWDNTPTCGDVVHLIQGFHESVAYMLGILDEKVRCHHGWDGVINLKTKGEGNTGLTFTELGRLKGMAAKHWDVKQYSYT
jgi:hypothetical protein